MPTNDERRFIAARLREVAPTYASRHNPDWSSSLCSIVGSPSEIFTRLADLIEPHYGLVSVIVDEDDICLECGEPLTENANYCAMCGKEVANAD